MARWLSHSCETAPKSNPANGFWSWALREAWAAPWYKRRPRVGFGSTIGLVCCLVVVAVVVLVVFLIMKSRKR